MTPESEQTATLRVVSVRAEPIELCQLLKFAGLAESGGTAKQAIVDRRVRVNDAVETRKRKKILAGDRVTLDGKSIVVQLG
jgi:ribosome-associated protein